MPLAEMTARLKAEVGCYAFLVMDLRHLLPAGLLARSDQVLTTAAETGRVVTTLCRCLPYPGS